MKLICPISAVSWTIGNPVVGHAKSVHPMLAESISVTELNAWYLTKWASGKLDPTRTYLLGLAYILKLPLEEVPALRPIDQDKFLPSINANMERLATVANKIEGRTLASKLPKFRCSRHYFDSLPDYLRVLQSEMSSAAMPITNEARKRNSKFYTLDKSMSDTEISTLILRGVRGAPMSAKAHQNFCYTVLNWLEGVAPFPASQRKKWRDVVIGAFCLEGPYTLLGKGITTEDVEALRVHCHNDLTNDTVHSFEVFRKLQEAEDVLAEFTGRATTAHKLVEFLTEGDEPTEAAPTAESLGGTGVTHAQNTARLASVNATTTSVLDRLAKLRGKK